MTTLPQAKSLFEVYVLVNALTKTQRPAEYSLSDSQFKFICDKVYDTTGIVLDERKREMVYRRLMRRTRQLNLPSFDAYCKLLQDGSGEELPNFTNAITTNLTSFFRESHHFDYLTEKFLPHHADKYRHTHRLRIWSAACSTGEEAYSLAITLLNSPVDFTLNWDVKILATDLDTDVLSKAKTGIYSDDRIENLPRPMIKKWFRKGTGSRLNQVKVSPDLANLITFKQLNLLHQWPMQGPFDVVVCRNVLIYFDKPTQEKLIHRFHQVLRPGGLLILGHSESLSKSQTEFKLMGRTVFEKVGVSEQSRGL
jgi:chemotaxis protein methyltransferase CheR